MNISVTKEDIRHGQKCNRYKCPIALAAMRSLYRSSANYCVQVGFTPFGTASEIAVWCDDRWHSVLLPKNVHRFMATFDRGGKVKPFDFDLEIPDVLDCWKWK